MCNRRGQASNLLGLSALLTNIMMGTILVNVMRHSIRVFTSVNDFASPVYVLFFTLAGASLDVRILMSVGVMGVAYIFARAAGKCDRCQRGARLTKLRKQSSSTWASRSCPREAYPSAYRY